MTDEERLHMITEQLLIVRDNLFRGMSKSIQKLQARSINEVLELPNFTESPQRTWVGLTDEEMLEAIKPLYANPFLAHNALEVSRDEYQAIEAKLKQKNGYAEEKNSPLQLEERNFCQRCGKRTNDIHTCTPPQDNT